MAIAQGDVLLRRSDDARFRVVRIVSDRGSKDLPPSKLAVIRLRTEETQIETWSIAKARKELADGLLVSVDEPTPQIDLSALSEAQKKHIDRRWKLIERIKDFGTHIFDRRARGQFAKKLSDETFASKPFFYETLRHWMQSGDGGKRGLVPNFDRCGAPNKDRIAEDNGKEPTGRKREVQKGPGLKLTQQHRYYIQRALDHAPIGKRGRTVRHAWYWMLITYYAEYVRIVPLKEGEAAPLDEDGKPLPPKCKVLVATKVPSLQTFRYHYNKKYGPAARARQRMPKRAFDVLYSPHASGTLLEVDGIGQRYYIDATIVDEYVVSRFNRNRIIGRPTLYLVVDQFSRMIVGMYVGLEPPCAVGALLALYNCSVDKVRFCARYGIDESLAACWPTGAFPQNLMGDRGEHIGYANDRLVEGFGITLNTSAPYSGAAKGVCERSFRSVQEPFGPYMPGHVDKAFMGRGEEKPALKAVLNIDELTRVLIMSVLEKIRQPIRDYEFTDEQVRAGVPSTPIDLWNWCVAEHRVNHRKIDLDHLKRYLWPSVTLKTARKLLRFCTGLYFQGEEVVTQDWLYEALRTKAEFDARYHPLDLSSMLMVPRGRAESIALHPTKRCKRLATYSFSELRSLRRQNAILESDAAWEATPYAATLHGEKLDTVREAKREAREQATGESESASARMRGIRENRDAEVVDRSAQAFHLNDGPLPEQTNPSIADATATDDAVREMLKRAKAAKASNAAPE
jgi:hypothetical protein